jgi:hypothetical protein
MQAREVISPEPKSSWSAWITLESNSRDVNGITDVTESLGGFGFKFAQRDYAETFSGAECHVRPLNSPESRVIPFWVSQSVKYPADAGRLNGVESSNLRMQRVLEVQLTADRKVQRTKFRIEPPAFTDGDGSDR